MVRWTKNGQNVKQGRYVRLSQELVAGVTKVSLKFDQVFPEDEGEYTCTVIRNGNVVANSKGNLQIVPGNKSLLYSLLALLSPTH